MSFVNVGSFNQFVADSVIFNGEKPGPAAGLKIVESTALTGFFEFSIYTAISSSNKIELTDYSNMWFYINGVQILRILANAPDRDSYGIMSHKYTIYKRLENGKVSVRNILAGSIGTTYRAVIIANRIAE